MKCPYCSYTPVDDEFNLLRELCEYDDETILEHHMKDHMCEVVVLLKRVIDMMEGK